MKTQLSIRAPWLLGLLLAMLLFTDAAMATTAAPQTDTTIYLPVVAQSKTASAPRSQTIRSLRLQKELRNESASEPTLVHASADETDVKRQFERFRCQSSGNPAGAVDMSCNSVAFGQDVAPDNEIAIAVNPLNPQHLVAGSNDELISYDPSGTVRRVLLFTGFFTSFDGGQSWLDGQIPLGNESAAGDPSPAFDGKHNVVLMATFKGPSIGVSRSTDGGIGWSNVIEAMPGKKQGNHTIFWDKEWLTVDNTPTSPYYGRAYLVAIRDLLDEHFTFMESPIYFSYSDDGGLTWSEPKEISGMHPSCTYQTDGPSGECDEDAHPYGVVATNGTLYVHFINSQNSGAWEVADDFDSQVMVVKSSDGGATFSAPVQAVQMEDGSSDMPYSFFPHQTIWGHQISGWSPIGTIAVDPTNAAHLTVVFADRGTPNPNATPNCLATPTAPLYDPCNAGPGVDLDVYRVESLDGGVSWGGRAVVEHIDGPAWFPWAGYKPDETLVVAWDQDTGPAPVDTFVHVLKVGNQPATALGEPEHVDESLTDWTGEETTALPTICGPNYPSNPMAGKDCNWFDGDYNSLAVGSDGSINVVWTGFNQFNTSPQLDPFTGQAHVGYRQDAMFARR
ncbi:MAG: sialidase family protein [Caldilineaceae bacterium]